MYGMLCCSTCGGTCGGGGGGKNVLANSVALPALLLVVMVLPVGLVVLSDGILGRPSSPGGLLRNLLAVQMSAEVKSFR